MSVFGDSQVRGLFVGSIDQATGVEGEVGAYSADGTATAAGESFVIQGYQNGKLRTIGPIDPDKVISRGVKVLKSWAKKYYVKINGTPTAGEAVEAVVYLNEYGAINSHDAGAIRGSYVVQLGDAVTDVIDELAANLNKSLRKSGIDEFNNVGPGETFGITAHNDGSDKMRLDVGRSPFRLGKFDGKTFNLRFVVKAFDDALEGVVQETVRAPQLNNGIEIANLEWFMEGNYGDVYRGSGYPNNFETIYNTDPKADYKIYEIVYYSERIGAPGDKQRQMVTIANSADVVALEAQIDAVFA